MNAVWSSVTAGVIRYEAVMALRRRVLWLCLGPLTVLAAMVALSSPVVLSQDDPVAQVGQVTLVVNLFYTVGIGITLTDRLAQQYRVGLADLLDSTPSGPTTCMIGAVLGPLGITLVPVTVLMVLVGVVLSIGHGSPAALGAALIGLGAVVVPAALVITALATLLGVIVAQSIARALVVVLWFWSTIFSPALFPGVPTPTDTVLSPLGGYLVAATLHVDQVWANQGQSGPLRPIASGAAATANVALLLGLAVVFFAAARVVAARRANREPR